MLDIFNAEAFGKIFSATPIWAWALLLGMILVGVIAGKILQFVLNGLHQRSKKRDWTIRASVFSGAATPAALAVITFCLRVGLGGIELNAPVADFFRRVITLLYILAVGWFLYNLVDIVEALLQRLAARTASPLDDQLVPLVRKALRIFLVVVLILFTAENVFGANISAWLAGLGIAGLAVSLAAQDSLKNVFGSLTIFLDRPFMVGDRVIVESFDGTIESIGFRSTKIRTVKGHLVTIPNSKIVDGMVENVQQRPSIRRTINVTITYDTPPDKIERAVAILRELLAAKEFASAFNPHVAPPRVYFNELNSDSLNIIVHYWFTPADYWAYLDHAQRFNLQLLRRFNEEGIEFAFPTRTLYLAGDEKRQLSLRLEPLNHLPPLAPGDPPADALDAVPVHSVRPADGHRPDNAPPGPASRSSPI